MNKDEKKGANIKNILLTSTLITLVILSILINIIIFTEFDFDFSSEKPEEGEYINQFSELSYDEIISGIKGNIPILEYHIIITPRLEKIFSKKSKRFRKKIERYAVTSQQFREHLETLYLNNYRNISLDEYLSLMKGEKKTIKRLPPNTKLYVLTFDDATYGQFDFIKDEKTQNVYLDPDCALGIMLDFAKKHPDFKLNAAFCIDFSDVPFLQKEYVGTKLNILLDFGFEIVNHTKSHKNLFTLFNKKGNESIYYELGKAMELFESYLGYRVATIDKICYPDGGDLKYNYDIIKEINYKGRSYHFRAALDAEGPLAINPNSRFFNPYKIRRIEINQNNFGKYIINAKGVFQTPSLLKKQELLTTHYLLLSNRIYETIKRD